MSALQTLRELLSLQREDADLKFLSIELVRPGFTFSRAKVKAADDLTLMIGHAGEPPQRITGHLFDDNTGHLISRLHGAYVQSGSKKVLCAFHLPAPLTTERVCLVIEGHRTGSASARREMTFCVELGAR